MAPENDRYQWCPQCHAVVDVILIQEAFAGTTYERPHCRDCKGPVEPAEAHHLWSYSQQLAALDRTYQNYIDGTDPEHHPILYCHHCRKARAGDAIDFSNPARCPACRRPAFQMTPTNVAQLLDRLEDLEAKLKKSGENHSQTSRARQVRL